jgi:hypothetical protein
VAAGGQRRVDIDLARPSMTANTKEDSELKTGLIDDVMSIINIEGM